MTARGLLRFVLLLALVPLLLRTRVRSAPAMDDDDDFDFTNDPDLDAESADGLIDINSASQEVLATLPGVGPVHAEAIVQGRPYRAKLDLLRRGIISEATYQTIRDQVIARHRSLEPSEEEIGSQGHA
ncbi:MAG: ComEA family DNA-binding protein [Gemmatimonadales bacterium]